MPGRRQGRGKKPRLWVSELSCRRFDRNAGGLLAGRAALSSRPPPRGRRSFPGAEASGGWGLASAPDRDAGSTGHRSRRLLAERRPRPRVHGLPLIPVYQPRTSVARAPSPSLGGFLKT